MARQGDRDHSYFMGAIVIVNHGDRVELLDGQQRLATATLLLSVIRDKLSTLGAQDASDAAGDTQRDFIGKTDRLTGETNYYLILNVYDRDFFKAEVQEFPQLAAPAERQRSHGLIRQARAQLRAHVDAFCSQLPSDDALVELLRLQQVLTGQVTVIEVSSTDAEAASDVFETLNDRGIILSTSDLVRTLLLRQAPAPDRDEIVSVWGQALELEEPANIDDLLRYYWITRNGDIKTRSLYRTIKTEVVDGKLSSLVISREIRDAAESYSAMLRGVDASDEVAALFKGIRDLGAKALYPALLALDSRESPPQREQIIRALVTYYVRHTVVGGLSNSVLETRVYDLAKEIKGGVDATATLEKIASWCPSDADFTVRFEKVSVSRLATGRYLLEQLELQLAGTGEYEVTSPKKVHVEHIYPQSPPARWPNHDAVVNRLGNLTLLGQKLNQQASNKDFVTKQSDYYSKSALKLNSALLLYPAWDATTIETRQKTLASLAAAVWPRPA